MIRVLLPVPDPAPPRLWVTDEPHHYLAHVLRVREGDAVEVFDGKGRAFPATVASIAQEHLELTLGEPRHEAPQRRVTVVQGLPRGEKLEWVVEKAVELGAAAVLPVETARAVVKLDPARAARRRERWQKIASEAARQCGRSDVPVVLPVSPLAQVRGSLEPGCTLLVLDEEERATRLVDALPPPPAPVALVVGPEGGLTREEVVFLVSEGGVPVSLGSLILRTETAALAALCVVRHRDGQLG
jgi:16S rRNA (uracil1498-N3)-methyltransferase